MRRVLLVTHRAVPGGAQRALRSLARRLPEQGWSPAVVTGEPGRLEEWLREDGVPVRRAGDGTWSEAARPAAVAATGEAARAHRADAVLGLCAEGHRIGGAAAAALGLPAVWWQMLTPRGRPYERAAAAVPAAATVCLTAAAAARAGRPAVVVPPGVDVAAVAVRRGSGRALRRALAPDGPLVGIVGRLDPAKGQDDLLHAVAQLDPAVRAVVVGGAIAGHEGDLVRRLRALTAALGLGDRVAFTGHLEDPLPHLDALDVLAVPSHHEAFGLVCVEALALGVPVVATDTDGPRTVLGPDGLVPVGDPAALAAGLRRALAGPRRLADGPARARAFDERVTARRMAAVLERVSAAAPAGAGWRRAAAGPAAAA